MQSAIKKNYKTFKEAFEALPEATKKHSLRVAEYTRTLFVEAMAIEMRMGDKAATAQLKPEHERGAYLCGLYHDIGKALVPIHYQNANEDFTAEETALYRKHTADGLALARQMVFAEELSDIEKEMIYQAIESHHERPDGTGFPRGQKEKEIPLMPLLVSLANNLDHRVTIRRSETPFDDVFGEITARFDREHAELIEKAKQVNVEAYADEDFFFEGEGSELHLLVQEAGLKLRRVFVKYQDQSVKIPAIVPFVKRRNTRSFELKYRPILDRRKNQTVALWAKMYFKDNKDTYVEYEEVKTILNKNKLIPEVGRYFMYEAGDTMKRIETCELPIQYIALDLMPMYYSQTKIVATMQQHLAEARLEAGKILFVMDATLFDNPSKAFLANVERMTAADMPIFINGWRNSVLSAEDILQYSIKKVALHPEMYEELESKSMRKAIETLQKAGVEVLAGEIEKTKYNTLLNSYEVTAMTGPMAGDYQTEDEMIISELKMQFAKNV